MASSGSLLTVVARLLCKGVIEEIIEGTTVAQVLTSVQYDENELKRRMKTQIDAAIKSDRLKPSEGMRLLDDYENGLKNNTYLTF